MRNLGSTAQDSHRPSLGGPQGPGNPREPKPPKHQNKESLPGTCRPPRGHATRGTLGLQHCPGFTLNPSRASREPLKAWGLTLITRETELLAGAEGGKEPQGPGNPREPKPPKQQNTKSPLGTCRPPRSHPTRGTLGQHHRSGFALEPLAALDSESQCITQSNL